MSLYFPVTSNPSRAATLPNIGVPHHIGVLCRVERNGCSSMPPAKAPPTCQTDWYFIAAQPAPAPHLAHTEGCATLRFVLVTAPPVSRSCKHFPDQFDLHLLGAPRHARDPTLPGHHQQGAFEKPPPACQKHHQRTSETPERRTPNLQNTNPGRRGPRPHLPETEGQGSHAVPAPPPCLDNSLVVLFVFTPKVDKSRGRGAATSKRCHASSAATYRGASLTRNHRPVGLYRRPMPRVLGGS